MTADHAEQTGLGTALWRGVKLRCPRCGEGRLLTSYLRQAPACTSCGLETGLIRADDGPPWLTLLIAGHILAPLMVIIFMNDILPMWISTILLALASVALCMALLPRAKGFFIAAIWKLGAQDRDMSEEV